MSTDSWIEEDGEESPMITAHISLGNGRTFYVNGSVDMDGDPSGEFSRAVLDVLQDLTLYCFSVGAIEGISGKGHIQEVVG